MTSMLGKWNRWYEGLTHDAPTTYGGDTTTYALGAKWLEGCDVVEDWGAGKGGLHLLLPEARIRGIDGSKTPFADVIADLTAYTSTVCGIFMRHVLEHNYDWRHILNNACVSAQSRIFISVFTPTMPKTRQINYNEDLQVPDIAFNLNDLLSIMCRHGFVVDTQHLITKTQYGEETVLRGKRP